MIETSKNPVVSIIMPTYNRGHLIARAIQSILDQTFEDFELIVIDDGSEDNTLGVVHRFDDKRIKYIQLANNSGAAAARNKGINAAKGKYIAFQDSDDEWFPDKLAKQVGVFEKAPEEVGVVYSGIWRIRKDKTSYYVPQDTIKIKEGCINNELLARNFIALPAAVVKKECFERVGMFDKTLPCLQDWELWIRISEKYNFKYINEPLLNAYYSGDSISIDYSKLIKAWDFVLTRHMNKFKKHKKGLSKKYLFVSHLEIANGDMKACRKHLLKSVKEYPFNTRAGFFLMLSLFGQKMYRVFISRIYQI